MRGKTAKTLRKIAQDRTVGLNDKLYHMPKRETHKSLTVELTSNCTRYWYKVFKRGWKLTRGKKRDAFMTVIRSPQISS